jgi:hypothetical protein
MLSGAAQLKTRESEPGRRIHYDSVVQYAVQDFDQAGVFRAGNDSAPFLSGVAVGRRYGISLLWRLHFALAGNRQEHRTGEGMVWNLFRRDLSAAS